MKWETVIATDFCDSVRDGTHDTPKQTTTGKRLVTSKHIKNGQILSEEAYFISEKDYKNINKRSLVEQWDVLMSMIGTVGEAAIVKEKPDYAIKNVALFKCGNEIKAKWLYYYLCSDVGKGQLYGNQKGSSQQFVSLTQLRNLQIPNPNYDIQYRITSILSAYDDLIENNRKQIKLLEEAAMRLYKEWFVHLRFPGHENTRIVDGVPEGWIKSSFESLGVLIKDSVDPKDIKRGTPYIGLEHMPRKNICLNEWGDAQNVSSRKFRFIENDILFGKIRPYFHKVGFTMTDGVCSTDAMVFRANKDMFGLLLMTAFSESFVKYTYATCKEGAKMPRADWNEMRIYPVNIPTESILKEFNYRISKLTELMKTLCHQISLLRQARDKLLPKLMSGEIEV